MIISTTRPQLGSIATAIATAVGTATGAIGSAVASGQQKRASQAEARQALIEAQSKQQTSKYMLYGAAVLAVAFIATRGAK